MIPSLWGGPSFFPLLGLPVFRLRAYAKQTVAIKNDGQQTQPNVFSIYTIGVAQRNTPNTESWRFHWHQKGSQSSLPSLLFHQPLFFREVFEQFSVFEFLLSLVPFYPYFGSVLCV
jgi:hypothetical protein